MRSRKALVALLMVLALAAVGARSTAKAKPAGGVPNISGGHVRAHIEFLADDLMEGREAGTRGFNLAANYVAAVLKAAGLKPAADDGTYFQKVPLRKSTISSSALTLTTKGGGAPVEIKVPDEGVVLSNHNLPSVNVSGDVVFAGYGVTAPEISYDDYAGIDAAGKIVLALYNAPAKLNSEIRAHYASPVQKLKNAANHGAAGIIFMFAPEDAQRIPWQFASARMKDPGYTTVQPDGSAFLNEPRMNAVAYVNDAGAQKLFAGASTAKDDAIASILRGEAKSFALAVAATIAVNDDAFGHDERKRGCEDRWIGPRPDEDVRPADRASRSPRHRSGGERRSHQQRRLRQRHGQRDSPRSGARVGRPARRRSDRCWSSS